MLAFFAFACNGFLIGIIVAFSSDQLSRILIPILAAAFGGSVAAFGKNLTAQQRREAYGGLLGLSLFCTFGVVIGIVAVQFRWLTPTSPALAAPIDNMPGTSQTNSEHYLKGHAPPGVNAIIMQNRQGIITKIEAYDRIVEELEKNDAK